MDYTVEDIEKRAIETIKIYKGKKGKCLTREFLTVKQWRNYCKQVLFLCEEIKKLRKKLGEK